jgi:hypothetical protein
LVFRGAFVAVARVGKGIVVVEFVGVVVLVVVPPTVSLLTVDPLVVPFIACALTVAAIMKAGIKSIAIGERQRQLTPLSPG